MTLDLSGLEALRAKKPPKGKEQWQPLDLGTLHPGTYLAADQSMTAFGLVLFEVAPDGCQVHLANKFTAPDSDDKGHEGTLRRVEALEDEIREFLTTYVYPYDYGTRYAVHEMPPVNKGRMARPEISLLTAYAWRRLNKGSISLPMVGRQAHAKLICGDGNATKTVHHAALKQLLPDIEGSDFITNEATRDALSLGIYAAWRGP